MELIFIFKFSLRLPLFRLLFHFLSSHEGSLYPVSVSRTFVLSTTCFILFSSVLSSCVFPYHRLPLCLTSESLPLCLSRLLVCLLWILLSPFLSLFPFVFLFSTLQSLHVLLSLDPTSVFSYLFLSSIVGPPILYISFSFVSPSFSLFFPFLTTPLVITFQPLIFLLSFLTPPLRLS